MKNICAMIALGVMLAGCTSAKVGQNFDITQAKKLQVGVSVPKDAQKALGSPLQINQRADGQSVWTYSFCETQFRATPGILLGSIGALAGVDQVNKKATRKNLTLVFAQNVLSYCLLVEANNEVTGTTVTGVLTPGSGTKREVACAGADPDERPPWLFVY